MFSGNQLNSVDQELAKPFLDRNSVRPVFVTDRIPYSNAGRLNMFFGHVMATPVCIRNYNQLWIAFL
jgi:hypothetical protein